MLDFGITRQIPGDGLGGGKGKGGRGGGGVFGWMVRFNNYLYSEM